MIADEALEEKCGGEVKKVNAKREDNGVELASNVHAMHVN